MKKRYVLLVLFIFLQGCGFEIVDTGYRGIKTKFGEVIGKPLPEGFHTYNPITSNIQEIDIRTQKKTGTISTYTQDVQEAKIAYAVNFNLNPADAHTMFKEVGKDYADKLLPQAINGALKAVIGKYEAVLLIANREKAREEVQEALMAKMAPKHIIITNFELENISFQEAFEDAVEKKVVAIQKADEAENNTIRIKEEAKQKVITAQAQAESIRIRAKALTQNAAIVDYEAVMKWDGVLPQYMLGGGVMPFINLNKDKK